MKKVTIPVLALVAIGAAIVSSCGSDEVTGTVAELTIRRDSIATAIESLRAELSEIDQKIAAEDSTRSFASITTHTVNKGAFNHSFQVYGTVVSDKSVTLYPEMAGSISKVLVEGGQRVKAGQLLVALDASVAQASLAEVKTQLGLAQSVYEKQERLWNQKIGTEIQYLEAKSRKEGLEKSLASLKTQLGKSTIKAPFNGTIETVRVRVGELVQPGTPMFQFVGESDLFIEADISESYIGALSKGDSVEITFPSINKTITTKVAATGAIINPNNRTFKVEVFLPNLPEVKPNMISVLKIQDYKNSESVVVPSHLILADTKGDYLFVVENGLAKKKYVTRGYTSGDQTEIVEGLTGSEILVDKGFREVGDNFSVNVAKQ